jgi:hypothetical protein
VDRRVRGGSSPLGRIKKALHSGAFLYFGGPVRLRRPWTCCSHVTNTSVRASILASGQRWRSILSGDTAAEDLLETGDYASACRGLLTRGQSSAPGGSTKRSGGRDAIASPPFIRAPCSPRPRVADTVASGVPACAVIQLMTAS